MLEATARLWLAGANVDWHGLHDGAEVHRVPLPTYPFERKRYLVGSVPDFTPVPQPNSEDDDHRIVDDWFWIPSWERSIPLDAFPVSNARKGDRWLIFRDRSEQSEVLARELIGLGINLISVFHADKFDQLSEVEFAIAPDRREDYDKLFSAILAPSQALHGIIHLWNTRSSPVDITAGLAASRAFGFYSLHFIAQAVGKIEKLGPLASFGRQYGT